MFRLLSLALISAAFAEGDTTVGFQTRYIRLGQQDTSIAIAADSAGNIFVLSILGVNAGQRLTKTDSQGNFIGSLDLNAPGAAGLAVDNAGNPIVVGSSRGTMISPYGGATGSTACVYRIDAAMTQILGSKCLGNGATGGSAALAVTVDSTNNIYITGSTWDPNFPVTPGAYQTTPPVGDYRSGPSLTATLTFVAKLTPDLGALVYSTFFGNSSLDCVSDPCYRHYATTAPVGIAVDSAGVVTIAGNSNSVLLVNPSAGVVPIGYPSAYGFAAKFSADGSSLLGFLAMAPYANDPLGVYGDAGGMAVDRKGGVVILGLSGGGNFGPNPIQPTSADPYPSFVVKYDSALKNVLWGTEFGDDGIHNNVAAILRSVAFDGDGNLWLTGSSRIFNLPGTNSSSTQVSTYVGEISADGSTLLNMSLTGNLGGYLITSRPGGVAVLGKSDSFLLSVPLDQSALYTVANSANLVSSGTIAPGELVSLSGSGIGPATGRTSDVVDGAYANSVAGYQVTFNGTPAPVLYAGPSQINVVVPFAVAGQQTAAITITGPAGTISFPMVFVAPSRPQIFSQPGPSGQPYAVAINQDGTVNSASNPAANGSIVTIFVSGAGLIDGSRPDGAINTAPFSYLPSSIGANVLYTPANVTYVGDAVGSVLGVVQVSLQATMQVGSSLVNIQAGNATSDYADLYISGP